MDAEYLEDRLAIELLGVVLTENVDRVRIEEGVDGRLVLHKMIGAGDTPQHPRHLSHRPAPPGVVRRTYLVVFHQLVERGLRHELTRRVVHVHRARDVQPTQFGA